MQSNLKYKECSDRKVKAAPFKLNVYCFILQLIADHQGSKTSFQEFFCKGPWIVEKILPDASASSMRANYGFYTDDDYANTSQIKYCWTNSQPDDDTIIAHAGLYVITWETECAEFPKSSGIELIMSHTNNEDAVDVHKRDQNLPKVD